MKGERELYVSKSMRVAPIMRIILLSSFRTKKHTRRPQVRWRKRLGPELGLDYKRDTGRIGFKEGVLELGSRDGSLLNFWSQSLIY